MGALRLDGGALSASRSTSVLEEPGPPRTGAGDSGLMRRLSFTASKSPGALRLHGRSQFHGDLDLTHGLLDSAAR